MNTPIQEILMLMGNQMVIIHEKDKEIIALKNVIEELRKRLENDQNG